jgi:signal peptidase II
MRLTEVAFAEVQPKARPVERGRALYACTVVLTLIIDQLTKAWVVSHLPQYRPTDLLPWLAPIFSLTHVANTGVAFGLFPRLGGLFAILSVVVVVLIVVFQRSVPSHALWLHGALGLVTGGAIGNVVDRIARGHVVDFIDVNLLPLAAWPVFNLADSAVVVGVLVLFVDSVLAERKGAVADA